MCIVFKKRSPFCVENLVCSRWHTPCVMNYVKEERFIREKPELWKQLQRDWKVKLLSSATECEIVSFCLPAMEYITYALGSNPIPSVPSEHPGRQQWNSVHLFKVYKLRADSR